LKIPLPARAEEPKALLRRANGEDQAFRGVAAAAGALVAVAMLVLMLVVVNPQPAGAALPGANGRIAYVASDGTTVNDSEIFTIPASGGPNAIPVQVTCGIADHYDPSYSFIGNNLTWRIAYARGVVGSVPGSGNAKIFTKWAGGCGKPSHKRRNAGESERDDKEI
jgi:hypothetical protein